MKVVRIRFVACGGDNHCFLLYDQALDDHAKASKQKVYVLYHRRESFSVGTVIREPEIWQHRYWSDDNHAEIDDDVFDLFLHHRLLYLVERVDNQAQIAHARII